MHDGIWEEQKRQQQLQKGRYTNMEFTWLTAAAAMSELVQSGNTK